MKPQFIVVATASLLALVMVPVAAQQKAMDPWFPRVSYAGGHGDVMRERLAHASLFNADRDAVGSASLTETPHGVLISLSLQGLPAGDHAFHIHAVGKCEPPFTSAGGHFNPGGKKHGIMAFAGPHAGDMPNLHIPTSGDLTVEVLNAAVTLEKGKPNSLFDADGTALVIHAGADDYKTDPTGDAGGRIACGVVK